MAVSIPMQTAFNGGKFGRKLKGRTDLARYSFGCETMQNFFPTVQGPAIKRSGTKFVKDAISPTVESRLIPFEFSDEQSYMLEFGVGEIRMYRNNGAVLEAAQSFTAAPTAANPVVCTDTSHPFSDGDSVYITGSAMAELNGRFFTVANAGANDYELAGEDGTGRTTGTGGQAQKHFSLVDGVSSDSVPWSEAELKNIQFVQNDNSLYLVDGANPPHVIERTSDLVWTCTEIVFDFPPLATENDDSSITVSTNQPLTTGGPATITGVGTSFSASDVGRLIAIAEDPVGSSTNAEWAPAKSSDDMDASVGVATTPYLADRHRLAYQGRVYRLTTYNVPMGLTPPFMKGTFTDGANPLEFRNHGWGYATITARASDLSITATVNVELPLSTATGGVYQGATTDRWAFSAFDEVNGYPSAVAFYEDRLWFGGTPGEPQTVWASVSGDYLNFRITPADFSDTGLQFTFLSDTVNRIRWMAGEDVLFAGTDGGEFTVDSGSASEAISPDNVRVRRRSKYGSAAVGAVSLASSLVFARKDSELREIVYSSDRERYSAPDLTQFSEEILRPGVGEVFFQADPYQQIWVKKTDGSVAVMTFDREEDVLAWCDFVLGGTSVVVTSANSIPHPDGDQDQVWLAVQRTVNGEARQFIEYLEKPFEPDDAVEDSYFVDAGLTYDSTAATTITGLWHLEGESVVILADGARVPNQTVSEGSITLTTAASVVQVGLQQGSARLRTLGWAATPDRVATGASQGWQGRVSNVILRVDTAGNAIEVGNDFTAMDEWSRRTPAMAMDTPVPLFTGDSPPLDLAGGYESSRQVAVRYDEPLPLTLISMIGKADTEVL